MPEASLGQKISWFFYQKGFGVAKPDFLFMVRPGDPQWFKIAEILFKDNNLEGRSVVLDQLLQAQHFRNHPKRMQFLRMLGQYLTKGILDERRRVVKYLDDNSGLFTEKDEVLLAPLYTAQRDSDIFTATTAESALVKIRGELKLSRQDFRD